jgi:hypothetical protein
MSGIVNLFVPASSFVTGIFVSNEEMTDISFAGLMTGQMLTAYSSIGNQSSAYFGQARASFASGSFDEEAPEVSNKVKFTVKAPKKGAKSPDKQALGAKAQEVKFKPLRRPDNVVFKPPTTPDPVGIVSTGTYTMTNLPWPSNFKVYLLRNDQWSGGVGLVYEYHMATDNPADVDVYDAVFEVQNFTSKGEVYHYDNGVDFKMAPSHNSYFHYEPEPVPPV